MLLRLMTSEISKYWPIIEASVKKTVMKDRPETEDKLNKVLRALLMGKLACWFFKDESRVEAVILTTIITDEFVQERSLLLYSVFTKNNDAKKWILTFDTLRKYAIDRKCDKMVFYTSREKIVSLSKLLGFNSVAHVCECVL